MKKIYAFRTLHFILVIIFAWCIISVYYYGLTDTFDSVLYIAVGILFSEAVALIINRFNCPMEYLHRRVGDDKRFFDHFFPSPVVPWVIPAVAGITLIGFLLLYW